MNLTIIKKTLLIIAGSISLALGVIGIIVPVLPTTPFLLLSCFCYLRSSKRLYEWLMHHKVFGRYIYNYMTYKAITKKAKMISLMFLWVSLTLSMLLVSNLHTRLLLLAVGIGVSAHLLLMKTIRKEDAENQQYFKSDPDKE